ncbi:MAG: hypothetical protein LBD88_00530 [Candidatus Peribacteria bacterium]|nr:hypothetical protein [Candidatus Peribacteria bacterium]
MEETTEPQAEVSEVEENIDTEPKLETKEELDEFTKLELDEDKEPEIPDWLK